MSLQDGNENKRKNPGLFTSEKRLVLGKVSEIFCKVELLSEENGGDKYFSTTCLKKQKCFFQRMKLQRLSFRVKVLRNKKENVRNKST